MNWNECGEERPWSNFKVLLTRHLPRRPEENHEKSQIKVGGALAEIWTGQLPNTSQNSYGLNQAAR
jgi:hypothetical protein